MVPLLILLAAYPERSAMATSLAAIGLIAAEGAIFFALHGDVECKYAALMGIPATVGVLGGTSLQQRLHDADADPRVRRIADAIGIASSSDGEGRARRRSRRCSRACSRASSAWAAASSSCRRCRWRSGSTSCTPRRRRWPAMLPVVAVGTWRQHAVRPRPSALGARARARRVSSAWSAGGFLAELVAGRRAGAPVRRAAARRGGAARLARFAPHHVKLQAIAAPCCHNQARWWACGAWRSHLIVLLGVASQAAASADNGAQAPTAARRPTASKCCFPTSSRSSPVSSTAAATTAAAPVAFAYPEDGSIVRAESVAGRSRATRVNAQARADLRAVSLFGGEVTVGAVVARTQASARTGEESFAGTSVTSLTVLGQSIAAGAGSPRTARGLGASHAPPGAHGRRVRAAAAG